VRLGLISLAGAGLFLWPFSGRALPGETAALAVAAAACAAIVAVELGARRLDSRGLTLLAAIAALDAGLRLVLVTGIGGFSPVFFLILCAGCVFGASFGFLAGAFSLIVSALATGGVGPWLPYQVFAAGWVGVAAAAAGAGDWRRPSRRRLAALAAAGALSGFAFGALMDVWDWSSFYRGAPDFGWVPGLEPVTALARFAHFYLATSLAYDSFRAAGNVVMVLLFGPSVLAALARLRDRLTFVRVA